MFYITFLDDDVPTGGVLTADRKRVLSLTEAGALIGCRFSNDLVQFIATATGEQMDELARAVDQSGTDVGHFAQNIHLQAPIPKPPRNLFCLGKNYAEHVKEIKNIPGLSGKPEAPIYFTKAPTTVIDSNAVIDRHSQVTDQVDYEAELAVIIGTGGADIPKDQAESHIFGYTAANDITARDLQASHKQWFKGKSLDTFCPMGPVIVPRQDMPLPFDLGIRCSVNGSLRQESTTSHMIFDIPTIIHDLSQGLTLMPGDIILTGTPAGVGFAMKPPRFLQNFDSVLTQIDGIGELLNVVMELEK